MASTYTPIATTTLGSSASSITFSSIPQTYTDLILITEGIGASGGSYDVDMNVRLNSDTGSNYSFTYIIGNGSSAFSNRGSNTSNGIVGGVNDSGRSMSICHFNNYSNTNTYKTFIARINRPSLVAAFVNLWRSNSAISTIYLYPDSSKSFAAGFTFTLYGILSA
jgi:hypothetical protein